MDAALRVSAVAGDAFRCGPVDVRFDADARVAWKFAETCALYDLRWQDAGTALDVYARVADESAPSVAGSFLRCGRMLVDTCPDGLVAATRSGASARLRASRNRWDVTVPHALLQHGRIEELEDIVSLVLTTAWRSLGWVPMHGGAVVREADCAMLCAPTGGGKSTMTAAAVRRGWRTLGDDKLLLRVRDGAPELRALLHTFNLHPRTQQWFPEVGAIAELPRYSAWTEKRKVQASRIWPSTAAFASQPTALIVLERSPYEDGIRVTPLAPAAVLETLLRQTVIPAEPSVARVIVATVTRTARALRGFAVRVGENAYRDPDAIAAVEAAVAGR